MERWGSSKTAATNNLQGELRTRASERTMMLSIASRFADAAEIYLVNRLSISSGGVTHCDGRSPSHVTPAHSFLLPQ